MISFLGVACIVDLTGIPQSDVTDHSWLSILLQTLELPIGIICCCVPNLKPAEISNAFKSLANRIFCCFQRIRISKERLDGPKPYQSSEYEPKAPFVRLDDSSDRVEMGRFPAKVFDPERGIELGLDQAKPILVQGA